MLTGILAAVLSSWVDLRMAAPSLMTSTSPANVDWGIFWSEVADECPKEGTEACMFCGSEFVTGPKMCYGSVSLYPLHRPIASRRYICGCECEVGELSALASMHVMT